MEWESNRSMRTSEEGNTSKYEANKDELMIKLIE
jgi:hypothetical protein